MTLFLLPMLGLLKTIVSAIGAWLSRRSLSEIALLGCVVLICVQFIGLRAEKRHSAKLSAQIVKCTSARHADQLAYTNAQAAAQAKNLADNQRTEQRQKEISDARVADLNSRLERIARELRDNPAAKGSAGNTPVPKTGYAPCRALDPTWLCLSPADRLLAAQNEERQDQLITWVIGQAALDPNN